MKKTLFYLVIIAALASCGKSKYKKDCCTGSIRIHSSNFNNTDSIYIAAPNAFTPNGDGINDVFSVFMNGLDMTTASLNIYKGQGSFSDRDEVFRGYEGNVIWDGVSPDGTIQKPGVYSYEFSVMTYDYQLIVGEGEFCLIEYDYNEIRNCTSCYFGDQFDPREGTFLLETHENLECGN